MRFFNNRSDQMYVKQHTPLSLQTKSISTYIKKL